MTINVALSTIMRVANDRRNPGIAVNYIMARTLRARCFNRRLQ